jgi:hypothetical protein
MSRQRQERTLSAAGALVERVRLAAMRWLILLKVLCCNPAAIALTVAASRSARSLVRFCKRVGASGRRAHATAVVDPPALNFAPESPERYAVYLPYAQSLAQIVGH